ncbi:MFS transporter [Georgenia ruanii]|uniref:MFS transporter n=1 Tax=Georgenia ruanii TaxID=348442 RepID=A0A7J9UYR7_9MICO|nr:MFS transporter [Georgenia ruanii]MPV89779.1 MFS transporter [Georgenia ruanii]
MTPEVRRARGAVAAVFLTNGALFANLIPRYPQIKADLGLSNAAYGTALAAFPAGALVAGLLAGALIARFRSSRVATLGIVVLAAALMAVSVAPTALVLAVVLFVAGGVDAIVDVAQNAHGLRVQRLYRRSIVNSFHGLWSVGAVAGGLMGAAAAGLAVPLPLHLGVSAVLFGAVALVAARFMLPGPEDAEREAPAPTPGGGRRRVSRTAATGLAVLGVLAICGALVEDAGSSWAAVYLSGSLGADAATAGLGFVALSVAMTVGRLTGDRVVDRFGQATVGRAGGVAVALGMGLALAVPSVGTTLAGFALAGLGVATLIPGAMAAADELPGLPPGAWLTVVSWLLRIGFLASPPLVGLVADAAGLRVGLLTVVLAGAGMVLLGGHLAPRRPLAHL